MNKEELKKKIEKAKEAIKAKADDAVCFYKLHRNEVNAAIAAFVGGTIGTVLITKKLSSKGSDEVEDDADEDLDRYYDCRRVFNIDGKEIAGLYQYLGKKDGSAIWLDPEDEEFSELDKFFRDDNEHKF